MKKIIFFVAILILILSLTSVRAPTTTITTEFGIKGCDDGTIVGMCSKTKPSYCDENAQLNPNCQKCGCNRHDGYPDTTYLCNSQTGACEETTKRECNFPLEADCDKWLGVCFWTGTCKQCPDLANSSCSFFNGQANACGDDSCFLGKSGLGTGVLDTKGLCDSKYSFPNYACSWDGTTNECSLSCSKKDASGNSCTCSTKQTLGACIDDVAELLWSRTCTILSGTGGEGCTNVNNQKENIACGKAISPMPFFTTINFILAIALLFAYYALKTRHSNRVKR